LQKKRIVWLYLLVVTLSFFRDVVILVFFLGDEEADWMQYTVLGLMFIDAVLVSPATLYCCFYLYRSTVVQQLTVA